MKNMSSFSDFLNESAQSSLEDYKKLLQKHDWYFQMSDDDRWYKSGLAEEGEMKKTYDSLSPENKKKAHEAYLKIYKERWPDSDYRDEFEKFNGA